MKQVFLLLLSLHLITFGQEYLIGQEEPIVPQKEFKVYKNGLIYSPKAMKKLRRKAKSLNSKYKISTSAIHSMPENKL